LIISQQGRCGNRSEKDKMDWKLVGSTNEATVKQDIDPILGEWKFQPGAPQVRMVEGGDGRQVLQLRIDLGILQMEKLGRPDGERPHGFSTYFDYLSHQVQEAETEDREFVLSEAQSQEADREFVQFYHRRICWLALQNFARAVADADHTLAFMEFVRKYSPDESYAQARDQYRGFVLFQRTQAAAALRLERSDPEGAIDELQTGLKQMNEFFAGWNLEGDPDDQPMIQHLRKIETSVREQHHIGETLHEQLERAVANEDYENAARLRDVLRKKQ
jgi:hypothetical protein